MCDSDSGSGSGSNYLSIISNHLGEVTVSKEDFLKFVEIQYSGKYNMFMQAVEVCEAGGFDMRVHAAIIDNYQDLYRLFVDLAME